MPRPQRGVPLRFVPWLFAAVVAIYFLLRVFLRGHSLHTGYFYVYHPLVAAQPVMSDDGHSLRERGEPNAEMYKKAKNKYKTYNADAKTEFARLNGLNTRQTACLQQDVTDLT